MGIRTWWVVPPQYGFGSTQTRRSTFSAWGTFAAFRMRSGYGFTPVRVTHVPSTANERTTHWLRESFKFFPRSLALRTAHLARACCARDKCVVCAYPALPQFYCPMSTQNWRGPYRVSTCSALTTHVVRTDFCSIYKRDFWRTSEGRSIYPPPPPRHWAEKLTFIALPRTYNMRVSKGTVREQHV